MEKRNNKKLFAIIGGSVLAFVLTIALSVSITLAYFGDFATGQAVISTSGSVEVGTAETFSTGLPALVPGQKVAMSIEANVTSNGTADGYLVAIVSTDGDANVAGLVTGNVASGWHKAGTATGTLAGDVYLYGTSATEASKLTLTTADQKINLMKTDATVPTDWKNETHSNKTATIKVTFVAVQPPIDSATGAVDTTVTYSELLVILNDILTGQAVVA